VEQLSNQINDTNILFFQFSLLEEVNFTSEFDERFIQIEFDPKYDLSDLGMNLTSQEKIIDCICSEHPNETFRAMLIKGQKEYGTAPKIIIKKTPSVFNKLEVYRLGIPEIRNFPSIGFSSVKITFLNY